MGYYLTNSSRPKTAPRNFLAPREEVSGENRPLAKNSAREKSPSPTKLVSGRRMFAQLDPISFNGGDYNLYRYVFNTPLNYIDPLGLKWVEIPDSIAITSEWEIASKDLNISMATPSSAGYYVIFETQNIELVYNATATVECKCESSGETKTESGTREYSINARIHSIPDSLRFPAGSLPRNIKKLAWETTKKAYKHRNAKEKIDKIQKEINAVVESNKKDQEYLGQTWKDQSPCERLNSD